MKSNLKRKTEQIKTQAKNQAKNVSVNPNLIILGVGAVAVGSGVWFLSSVYSDMKSGVGSFFGAEDSETKQNMEKQIERTIDHAKGDESRKPNLLPTEINARVEGLYSAMRSNFTSNDEEVQQIFNIVADPNLNGADLKEIYKTFGVRPYDVMLKQDTSDWVVSIGIGEELDLFGWFRHEIEDKDLLRGLSNIWKAKAGFGFAASLSGAESVAWHYTNDLAHDLKGLGVLVGSTVRGIRNNNPGNLRSYGIEWQGKTGVDTFGGLTQDRGFVQFRDMTYGIRAMFMNMHTQIERGNDTIRKLITVWAPGHENNTQAYINYVVQRTGIPANARLNTHHKVLYHIGWAIMEKENGRDIARSNISDRDVQTAMDMVEQSRTLAMQLPRGLKLDGGGVQRAGFGKALAIGGSVVVGGSLLANHLRNRKTKSQPTQKP